MTDTLSPSKISNLLETQTYDPNIVPQLESYLHSQIQSAAGGGNKEPNPYNFQANRTLVKLYQFFPKMAKNENLILVELLALVYGNDAKEASVDFGALGCLISETVKKEEPFPALIRCAELLDSCQFAAFWTAYKTTIIESSGYYARVSELARSNHAQTALRRSILNNLSLAYQSSSTTGVMAQLNLDTTDQLKSFITQHTDGIVEEIRGDKVVFVSKTQNTKREKVYQEGGGVDYTTIRNLMLQSGGEGVVSSME